MLIIWSLNVTKYSSLNLTDCVLRKIFVKVPFNHVIFNNFLLM